ncbi:hypothetical protein [Vibrio sp. DNB22_12_1]
MNYPKLLLVTAAAPPSGGSHAQRVVALVKHFKKSNYDIDVVIPRTDSINKERSTLFKEMESMANIIEVDAGSVRKTANRLNSVKGRSSFLARLIQKLRAFVRKNAIPDTFIFWVPKVIKSVNLSGKKYDTIVSSGAPFSSHVAAGLLSQKQGASLVLDYGDPWVYEPGRPRKGIRLKIERFIEQALLKSASYVSFTTLETVELYREKYSSLPDNYHAHYMGYEPKEFDVSLLPSDDNKYQIVYAGRVNEEYRKLDSLIEFLESIIKKGLSDKFVIIFYGSELDSVSVSLSKFVELGLVEIRSNLEHKDYINTICNANSLIILGNDSLIQIPGKVIHYLASKKSILYFPNNINKDVDPAFKLIQKYLSAGYFYMDDSFEFDNYYNWIRKNSHVEYSTCNHLDDLSWNAVFNGLKVN